MVRTSADKACCTERKKTFVTWFLTTKFRLEELLKYGFELFVGPSTITWMSLIPRTLIWILEDYAPKEFILQGLHNNFSYGPLCSPRGKFPLSPTTWGIFLCVYDNYEKYTIHITVFWLNHPKHVSIWSLLLLLLFVGEHLGFPISNSCLKGKI